VTTTAQNPYLFVVGCPRSGTTLLQRMLDHHPRLAVANDTHFVPRCLEKLVPEQLPAAIEGRVVPLTQELVDGVLGYHRFHRMGIDSETAAAAARRSASYQEYVGALYDLFAERHGKPLAGEKTPDYVRRLPLLAALFPWARFLHIIRDGRDVALSVLEWADATKGPGKLELWKTEPLATCALWWRWQVQAGRRGRAAIGRERCREVRYETLVSDPAGELRAATDFLALPYRAEMLEFHVDKVKPDATGSAKSRWLPPTQGLRDWRKQMPERELLLFEALAGDVLDACGYERSASRIPPEIDRLAVRCRSWWDAFLARRERKSRRRMEIRC